LIAHSCEDASAEAEDGWNNDPNQFCFTIPEEYTREDENKKQRTSGYTSGECLVLSITFGIRFSLALSIVLSVLKLLQSGLVLSYELILLGL
jgi:hypothetical protein